MYDLAFTESEQYPSYSMADALQEVFMKENELKNILDLLKYKKNIILHGPPWYRDLSRTGDGGTKLYGVSGKVKRPGVWELPMGTTMREILEEHAGGMRDGLRFRGLLPGGASTGFLVAEHLDVKMDYSSIQEAGSRLGTGTLIVLDDRTCPVGMLMNLQKFFAQESCGWRTPCRDRPRPVRGGRTARQALQRRKPLIPG